MFYKDNIIEYDMNVIVKLCVLIMLNFVKNIRCIHLTVCKRYIIQLNQLSVTTLLYYDILAKPVCSASRQNIWQYLFEKNIIYCELSYD